MKKVIVVGLIVVVLLLLAPFGIGQLAAKRINDGLDNLVIEAPFLSIVERKYHGGWFSSDLDVTFEMFGGLAPSLGDKDMARFTVHNDISHGPILGSGLGLARVKTHFVIKDEKTRAEMEKIFGKEDPIDITTTFGLLGGGRTVVSSKARKFDQDGESVSWDALNLVIESTGSDAYKVDGAWPKFSVHSKDGSDMAFNGMRISGSGKRLVGNLFLTDVDFTIAEVGGGGPAGPVSIKDVHYIVASSVKDNLVDMSVKFGCGAMQSPKLNFTEAHYDLTVRKLHPESLDKLLTAWKTAVYTPEKVSSPEGMFSPALKQSAMELLKRDPELSIDRISFAMEEGAGSLKGIIRFKGVTAEDFEMGAMSFFTKIIADLDIDVAEALVVKLAGSTEPTDGMVKQGFAELKDGHLVSKIVFQEGRLLINGKEQAIPGLGGPPAVAPTMQE